MAQPKHTVSIIVCARWETEYITEWLLYHKSIGFDHVYLYCNDDDPTELYGQVLPFSRGEAPFVTFHHFPFQGQQFYMLTHGLRHHKDETEWIAFLDIDEFLVLPELNDIQAFLRRCPPHWDSIHFNWSYFGNNGHIERPGGSVLCTYTRREENLHPATKTLTRTAKIDLTKFDRKRLFWHAWEGLFGAEFLSVNVLGVPMELMRGADAGVSYLKAAEIQAKIRNTGLVNHYAFKSARDFERRIERGILGDFSAQLAWKHVADAGRLASTLAELNAVEDTYLADYWRRLLRAGQDARIVPTARLPNIALGKHADQSSQSEWSRGATTQEDAAGAVNGTITGDAQCHTREEMQPWWMVDFGAPHLVYEVRVFNRVDQPAARERLGAFRVDVGDATESWVPIYQHDGTRLIGGADGYPLILRLASPATACRLRVIALGHTCLHLDQVEVYGVSVNDTEPAPSARAYPAMPLAPPTADRVIVTGSLSDLITPLKGMTSRRAAFEHVTLVVPAGQYIRRDAVCLDIDDLDPEQTQYYLRLMAQRRQDYANVCHVGLQGALVFGQGSVVTAEGMLIKDSCREFFEQGRLPPGLLPSAPGQYRTDHTPSRHIERPSLLLKRPFWPNFGHWLLDAAMLLALLPDLDLPADWQLVIGNYADSPTRPIVLETLSILAPGVPFIEHPDDAVWTFTSLQYVMPVQISPLIKLPRALCQLRSALLAGKVRPRRRRRLHILRSGSHRRMENEKEVCNLARQFGFETVRPEEHSLREQAALFQSAECILAVKGAALTNLMFCSGATSVMVLSPSDWPDPIFWDIAGQLGVAYHEQFGPVTDHAAPQGRNPFRIDLDRLAKHLAAMCPPREPPRAMA